MNRKTKLAAVGVSAVALAAGGVGIAQAVGGGESEGQVTGTEADKAKRAALEAVGGGRVLEVEREDDGRAGWEVEVSRNDGQQVEVHLDSDLKRVGVQGDDDGPNDRDKGSDDD